MSVSTKAARSRAARKQVGDAVRRKYINRREAAVYLGCSTKHVAALVATGFLPEYEFGRCTKRYTTNDLDAYALTHRKIVVTP